MVLAVTGLVLAYMTAVMLVGWFVQRELNNGGWSDVFWTFGTGFAAVVCALVPLEALPAPIERRLLIAGFVAIWSLRLGSHIAMRVVRSPEDARYAEMRASLGAGFPRAMLGLMVVQAPASAVLALAILIAAHAPAGLGLTDLLAAVILAIAIGGERLADVQLARFKARPENHGLVCDTGLWAWSRHPNYFFEWIGWLAYPLAALPFGFERPWFWLALVAPVLMYVLLTRVSGVPPLERAMLASRGDAYRRYRARVPAFFPRPPSGAPS